MPFTFLSTVNVNSATDANFQRNFWESVCAICSRHRYYIASVTITSLMIITVIVSCNFTSSASLSSNSTAEGEKLTNSFNKKSNFTTSDKRAPSFDSVPVSSSLSTTTVSSRNEKPESGNDFEYEFGMEDVKSWHHDNKDNDGKGVGGESNITSSQQTNQLCALVIDRDKNDFTSLPNVRSHE